MRFKMRALSTTRKGDRLYLVYTTHQSTGGIAVIEATSCGGVVQEL